LKNYKPGHIKLAVAGVLLGFVLLVGCNAGYKEYNRYQKRADAVNHTKIVAQEIKTAEQQAKVNRAQIEATAAEAEKMRVEAEGIRDSQNIIDESLTTSYLQYEAIKKLPHARAVYIPSGGMGIPQVQDVGTPLK
jgi:hypothetical protein